MLCPKCNLEVIGTGNKWVCPHCDTTTLSMEIEDRGYGVAAEHIIGSDGYQAPKNLQQSLKIALKYTLTTKPNLKRDVNLAESVAFTLSNEIDIAEGLRGYPAVQLALGDINEAQKRSILMHPMMKRMQQLSSSNRLKLQVIDISSSSGNEVIVWFDGFGLKGLAKDTVSVWQEFRNWLSAAAKNSDLIIQERFEQYNYERHSC